MKVFQAAIIGFGNIGYQYSLDKKRKKTWSHFEAFNKIKKTRLVAIVEKNFKKIKYIKKNFPKIFLFNKIEDLLKSEHEIDIFSICTPTTTHFKILKKLIQHKAKMIICEKPLCSSLTDARKIYQLSKKSKSLIAINHQRRYEKNFMLAKNLIDKNAIGNLKFINANYTRKIYNIGTHLIDILRMITSSELSYTSAFFTEKALPYDPSVSGFMKFKNNVSCSIQSIGNKFKYIFEIDITGTKGKIRIFDNGKKITLYKFQKSKNFSNYFELNKIRISKRFNKYKKINDPMKELIENLIIAYNRKNIIHPNVYDGYQNLLIAKMMEKSAKYNKIIKV